MISFLVGLILGGFVGMMIMACVKINKGDDNNGKD